MQGKIMHRIRENVVSAVAADLDIMSVKEIAEGYGSDVFNADKMRSRLPPKVFQALIQTIRDGARLDSAVADAVAEAMKNWAVENGATHYTHWFQPLTGATAEKHESFLEPDGKGHALLKFSGKNLIVGESDASSFPSGGLRSTFEARGYTAWDPSSPAFLRRNGSCVTLCIPTVFCSYTGESLDRKTPLLRSIQALSAAVSRLMKAFHTERKEAVFSVNLGAEQEYFLIDRSFYIERPDLIQCGRTLFGATPPKHQQLDDHYYGAIRPRILAFMADVDRQLWRLGIPAKTRHNEVAPAQFEIASIYEELNLAVDHNMLVMEVLRLTAERHGFVCLLHEKPFAGVNGSGKHNNWSVCYDGFNLLDPGNDPQQNAVFLTTLCTVIRAVDLHSDLLRAATAGAGNDHRLGGCEAPPAIVSIFLGTQLMEILKRIEKNASKTKDGEAGFLNIGVDRLPSLPKDTTDRNRTSPFAFTGNKFEFRSPGSSQSCAEANVVLNTIVAESMDWFANEIQQFNGSQDFNLQLQNLLREVIHEHKRILFDGNGYESEWIQEAQKRGLPNLYNTPVALERLKNPQNVALFVKYGVFSRSELYSRYEIFQEEYRQKIRIESDLSILLARTLIEPAAMRDLNLVCSTIDHGGNSGIGLTTLKKTAGKISVLLDNVEEQCEKLEQINTIEEPLQAIEIMRDLRNAADNLERLISDDEWPMPKYREILFLS